MTALLIGNIRHTWSEIEDFTYGGESHKKGPSVPESVRESALDSALWASNWFRPTVANKIRHFPNGRFSLPSYHIKSMPNYSSTNATKRWELYIHTLFLKVWIMSPSNRMLFPNVILRAAYEVKRQGNAFRWVEHELEKCFHAAFLNKVRDEWWKVYNWINCLTLVCVSKIINL